MSTPAQEAVWGVDSEHAQLHDVLLCPPDNFHWLPTSAISRATLNGDHRYELSDAQAQHAEMVSIYESMGVKCHFLETDPALPYQVFARDSSTMGPNGVVITQMNQWWRRGEYADAIAFYQREDIPIRGMITAGALEGGDVTIIEPGCVLIGNGETRTQEVAARQLASWFEEDGWEARVQKIPEHFVHIDVLVSIPAEKLAAVCIEEVPAGLVSWIREKGFDIIEVSSKQAMELGVNAISLGSETVLSSAVASELNDALRSRGLTVHDPDLSMFTKGGGGAHCLAQPLRRQRLA